MKTKAAVAWKSGEPLTIETVDLEGPKFGEVLVEIKASGGVRSLEQLRALHAAGATRFGVNSHYAQVIVKQAEEAQ